MVRTIPSLACAVALVCGGLHPPVGAADQARDKASRPKGRPGIAVTLQAPAEMTVAEVTKILVKVKALKTAQVFVGVAEKGQGLSAAIVATPEVSARAVGAVVQVLLEAKVTRISVEVKK